MSFFSHIPIAYCLTSLFISLWQIFVVNCHIELVSVCFQPESSLREPSKGDSGSRSASPPASHANSPSSQSCGKPKGGHTYCKVVYKIFHLHVWVGVLIISVILRNHLYPSRLDVERNSPVHTPKQILFYFPINSLSLYLKASLEIITDHFHKIFEPPLKLSSSSGQIMHHYAKLCTKAVRIFHVV